MGQFKEANICNDVDNQYITVQRRVKNKSYTVYIVFYYLDTKKTQYLLDINSCFTSFTTLDLKSFGLCWMLSCFMVVSNLSKWIKNTLTIGTARMDDTRHNHQLLIITSIQEMCPLHKLCSKQFATIFYLNVSHLSDYLRVEQTKTV
jgi:hypothetical protein